MNDLPRPQTSRYIHVILLLWRHLHGQTASLLPHADPQAVCVADRCPRAERGPAQKHHSREEAWKQKLRLMIGYTTCIHFKVALR